MASTVGLAFRVILVFLPLVLWGCGDQKEPGGKKAPKPNRPPVVKLVRIWPDFIFRGQEIQATVEGADPDGDRVTYTYQWEINGEVVSGAEGPRLSGDHVRRGDRVVVRVTPSDGKVSGSEVASRPHEVFNTRPVVRELQISSQPVAPGDPLEAHAVTEDLDGDAVQVEYIWSVNGKVVEGVSTERLATQGLKRGDRVKVHAIADDGANKSKPLESVEVVLQNRPPKILSQPPERLVSQGYYRYEVKAEDPDGDSLTFRLEGTPPEGMRIHPTRGLLEWRFPELPADPVVVDIRVSDGQGGEAEQRYDFVVGPSSTS